MEEAVIRLHIERLEEGGYVATSADVPGLVAEGAVSSRQWRLRKAWRERSPNRAWSMATRCRRRRAAGGRPLDVVVPVGIG